MAQLLVLARDHDRIEMIDTETLNRKVIITDTGPNPDGVVCDGETLYWTTMGQRTGESPSGEAIYADVDGAVHAIGVDGSNHREVVAAGDTVTGKQLALDSRGNLYWGNREGFSLATARTDGSGLRDLVKRDGRGAERDWIVGVALDEQRGHIYWSQKGSFAGGDGQIFRAGLEIPAGETAENRSDIELLWEGLPAPIDLELIEDRLLWTDRGSGSWPGGNSLNRARVPSISETAAEPTLLASGFAEAIGLAVDEQAQLAYVADLSGQIWRVAAPERGDTTPELIVDLGFAVTGINFMHE